MFEDVDEDLNAQTPPTLNTQDIFGVRTGNENPDALKLSDLSACLAKSFGSWRVWAT
jgi:hypothetical protein